MALLKPHPLKRTSSTAELESPAAKKLKCISVKHHKPLWDLQREQGLESPWRDDEAAQSMLSRSIGLALKAVGFDAADPVAIDSFRSGVEECMRSFGLLLLNCQSLIFQIWPII